MEGATVNIGPYLTVYAIRRDHSNKTEFFIVCVPEVEEHGIGFQVRIGEVVYGASVHTRKKERS